MENKKLFNDDLKNQPPKKKPVKWCMATNHLNLMFMLSAGLIMSPKGFGKKYFTDALDILPGWIPLFANGVPKRVIDASVNEASHLKPCTAIISLESLKGKITVISNTGSARQIEFPDGLDGKETCLLLQAPLPATWIESIAFQSKEDRTACEKDAKDFNNAPLSEYKTKVASGMGARDNAGTLSLKNVSLPNHDESPDTVLAAGAMMAMLFQFANCSDEAVKICRIAFDREENIAGTIVDPLIGSIYNWLETGEAPLTGDILPQLFWGAVNQIAATRSAIDDPNLINALLAFLDSIKTTLDDKIKTALTKLSDDLRSIAGYADSTITEIFERHPKIFSRVMALFILREKSSELLEFKHPLLRENDLIAAAILFAARDGWQGLPSDVRTQPGMNAAVSHRMAAMAHRLSKTGMDFGPPPPRPKPLRELFIPGPKGWTSKQKEAALLLAQENKWNFIQTKISLGKGEYQLIVNGTGAHILLPGEVKAVVTEVDLDEFFKKLPGTKPSVKVEKKIREKLQ